MPRPFSRSAAVDAHQRCIPAFCAAIAAHFPARRSNAHPSRRFRRLLRVAVTVTVVLCAACCIANVQSAAAQSTATSKSDRFDRFVAEAALRFHIPASWIKAVMQVESRGAARAVSPKGAMGLMQLMPRTWAELRSRYRLGADPFDPHDNILAGAAYLRQLYDRYGAAGFLAAYNGGPSRYEDHLASGRPLPAETQAYVAALAPLLRQDGSAPGDVIAALVRSWAGAPLFAGRASDASSAGGSSSGDIGTRRSRAGPAMDWTGFAPQAEGLFALLSAREPGL